MNATPMNRYFTDSILQEIEEIYKKETGIKNDMARLTDSQMGVFLQCMMAPDSTMYSIPGVISVKCPDECEIGDIKDKIDRVLKIHPSLYARIAEREDGVYMIRQEFPAEGIVSVAGDGGTFGEVSPFDLENGPLCRCVIKKDEEDILSIFLELHHVAADGSSVNILCRQITETLAGKEPSEETVDAFALWDAEQEIGQLGSLMEDARKYFEELLAGEETDSNLLADSGMQDAPGVSAPAGCLKYRMDLPGITEKLLEKNITKNSFFMGVYGYVLSVMTGQSSSMFTAGESGRNSALVNGTVSMMVKTLPVVIHIDEKESPWSLLEAVQKQFRNTMSHDVMSFGELAGEYGISADVSFVYQSGMLEGCSAEGIESRISMLDAKETFANLSTMVMKENGEYILRLEYNRNLYTERTIRRTAEFFERVAKAFLRDVPLSRIQLASEEDLVALNSFNREASEEAERLGITPENSETIVDVFARHAEQIPERTAVVFKDRSFTYGQVDEITDRIAAYVTGLGIGREQVVSVLIPRCEYMEIATLGILKAGAIYQPLDPDYPEERLSFMVEDADAKLILADRGLMSSLTGYEGPVLYTDEIEKLPAADRGKVRETAPKAQDTYILLYTSGTTGKPKGCRLTHKNIMAITMAYSDISDADSESRFACYASYGFDAHMIDLYSAIYNGGQFHVIPQEMRLDFPALKEYLDRNEITHICMTTQVGRQFAMEYKEIRSLKFIITGGEKLASFANEGNYRFGNFYGPSECTICVTGFIVDEKVYDNIPIGRAVAGNHLYVVDSCDRRVPIGAPGELIICGPQVGAGYLNRPEKTEEVFVPNTFEENPDEMHRRCYRTGDIVRYLEDGNLEFIGRRDQQVKIRGFRIELTEVEDVIRRYPGITDAVVIAVDIAGGKALHAYMTSPEKIDINSLNDFIREEKPAYMVPAAAMQIDSIPLTTNQKVDRRKLPEIKSGAKADGGAERSLTALEKQLVELLEEATGQEGADVMTSFTNAGVTSISSIRLATRIYREFGLKITSAEILDDCNILKVEDRIIAQLLASAGRGAASENAEAMEAEEKLRDRYPLTQTQMGIYLDSLRAGMGAYNIPMLLKLPENINTDKLKDSIKKTVRSHPSMLCGIRADENGDVHMFPMDVDIEIKEEESDSIPPENAGFSFDGSPLFSFRIIKSREESYLFMEVHHIIGDGESMTTLISDIDRAYRGEELQGEDFTAFALSLEEEEKRNGQDFVKAQDYYESVFKGVSADYLPCADMEKETGRGTYHRNLSVKPYEVECFCKAKGITANAFFTGVFGLALARYTAHEDALFATIYNGRQDPRTSGLVSMLVKTMPVYMQVGYETEVGDYMNAVSEHLKLLRQHDIFSFADAASRYGVTADVMFIYQGRMMSEIRLDGSVLQQIETVSDLPKAEICIELHESDDGFAIGVEYDSGHYSSMWIDTFSDAFVTCTESMLKAESLGQVEITSAGEFARFDSFNDTYKEIPYRPAYRLIEEQVDEHPDRLAVVARPADDKAHTQAAGKYEKLTFRQLDNMANHVAKRLADLGIEPGSVVGIISERTREIYVAEYGILKAGCAFLFLSPSYPDERISYIMEEGDVRAVITTGKLYQMRNELLKSEGIPVILADEIDPEIKAERPQLEVDSESLAYLIYTSGSTGKPKGVTICQRNLINLADRNSDNFNVREFVTDVTMAAAAFTFDASIIDGYCSLANGATVCIAADDDIHDPKSLAQFCLDNKVTSMLGTPSFLMSLLDYDGFAPVIAQLKVVQAGGEVFTAALYEKLRSLNPDLKILNGYGPSETTVGCTGKILTSSEDITIGRPMTNFRIYIVDKMNHVLPMGALGELIIVGEGVGKGYRNRDDLTNKVFITLMGEPAYRSGDLALISHDEEIRFHGRIDNQVKLRGLRVELGEIENAINSCDGVKSCIVTVNGAESNRYLAAFYTAEKPIESGEIITQISATLTEYMVPRVFMQLDEMPMTANGKIDKKALPKPVMAAAKREYVGPSNEAEKQLAEAFAKALGLEKVGVTEDFFELGGTSLSATKVAMFAMARNIEIAYKDVFANPTVRKLSALVGTSDVPVEEDRFKGDYSLTEKALAGNTWKPGDDPGKRPLGSMLLTGATGFLGMHVLKAFLEKEEGDVYCLMRKGAFPSLQEKLQGMFIYYFDEEAEKFKDRIHFIEGDITDGEFMQTLENVPFDTAFNCAACVKHFTNSDILEQVNVKGVENLVKLCSKAGKRLIQVSTISVAGEGIKGSPDREKKIHENELYFGQVLDNQYIVSKFQAEKIVLDAAADGLDAKIMRAGNLMPRYSDGEFQINHMTNGFMRRLHGYFALGCIPYSQLAAELEFSPIDETAAAMLELAETDRRFTVFHVNNVHRVFMADVIRAMNKAGLHVDCVDENLFAVRMQAALSDPEHSGGVSGLIAYMNRDRIEERYMLDYDNTFTASVLNRLGFAWNITDDRYVSGALQQLEEFGFFDFDIE